MAKVEKIGPDEVQQRMEQDDVLLVCAYDSEPKFRDNHLEGAISLDSFRYRLDTIPKDREIVFY